MFLFSFIFPKLPNEKLLQARLHIYNIFFFLNFFKVSFFITTLLLSKNACIYRALVQKFKRRQKGKMQKYKKIECLYMHECIKGMINNRSCFTYDACSLNLLMWLMFGKKNFDDIIFPLRYRKTRMKWWRESSTGYWRPRPTSPIRWTLTL